MTVQNPGRELCSDDALLPAPWVSVPLVRFSGSGARLNGRPVSDARLLEWATGYYATKAERALWVQISPEAASNAERALGAIVRKYPDLQLRQVDFNFSCPKVGR